MKCKLAAIPIAIWSIIFAEQVFATAIDTVSNSGTTSITVNSGDSIETSGLNTSSSNNAIYNSGTITNISNAGTISSNNGSGYSGDAIYNDGTILEINNSGTVDGGIVLAASSVINVLTNTGTISPGNMFLGIYSSGTLGTLNNSQAGLSFSGALPTAYNIIIRSSSSYGTLVKGWAGASGSMAFNIYGNSGTTLVSGVSASTVTAYRYTSVLQGFSSLAGITGTTGTYGSYNYSLVASSLVVDDWDLLVALAGPDSIDTQSSLQLTANKLQGLYALQTSAMTNSLSYDCSLFDKSGICVSTGGRYSRVNTGNTQETNGLLIGAYKVSPNIRVGAWLDQNLSSNTATGVSLNNGSPMFGVYGVWNENATGNGFEFKVSAGYGNRDLKVTRQVIGTSEAGVGETKLTTQGLSSLVSYNLPVSNIWVTSPYLGIRYTKVGANQYVEASTISSPLTYNQLNQESTTALVGIKLSGRVISKIGVFASAGLEKDLNSRGGAYMASGLANLTPVIFNPDNKKTRASVVVGAYYDVDKAQRISLTTMYREEAFQKVNTLSTMATYTAGF